MQRFPSFETPKTSKECIKIAWVPLQKWMAVIHGGACFGELKMILGVVHHVSRIVGKIVRDE
jgi:hypothetical protein